MNTANHPAYESMVSAAGGVLVSNRSDLDCHDRLSTRALDPRECFVWILNDAATHLVQAVADLEARESYRHAFDPVTGSCRSASLAVYFWDGLEFRSTPHDDAFDALQRAAERI